MATSPPQPPMPVQQAPDADLIGELIRDAKDLARRYRALTGRPLGITGEVAEFEAVRVLGLELAPVRQPGYDAIRRTGEATDRLQIKGRCIHSKKPGQQIGSIDIEGPWDAVLLVLLDEDLGLQAIYEARRDVVCRALQAPGSRARNERGALAVSKFKSIGKKLWPPGP